MVYKNERKTFKAKSNIFLSLFKILSMEKILKIIPVSVVLIGAIGGMIGWWSNPLSGLYLCLALGVAGSFFTGFILVLQKTGAAVRN